MWKKKCPLNIKVFWNFWCRIFKTCIISLWLKKQTNDWYIKWALFQNMTERSINVTSILNNFKSLMEQNSERGSAHKINKKEDQNIYFRADLSQRQIKLLTLKKKNNVDWLLIISKIYFFLKFKCYKSRFTKTCVS